MKKLISIALIMGILTIFSISAMFQEDVTNIRNGINRFINYQPEAHRIETLPIAVKQLTDLIEKIMDAKLDGYLSNVSRQTIEQLKQNRKNVEDFIAENEQIRNRLKPQIKQPSVPRKPRIVQPVKKPTRNVYSIPFQQLFDELKNNPSEDTQKDLETKEELLVKTVESAKFPFNPLNAINPRELEDLNNLLEDVYFAKKHGYLSTITKEDIKAIEEKKAQVEQEKEEKAAALEEMRKYRQGLNK